MIGYGLALDINIFNNGILVQYGVGTIGTATTFPITYNSHYINQLQQTVDATWYENVVPINTSMSGFTGKHGGTANGNGQRIFWLTIGY